MMSPTAPSQHEIALARRAAQWHVQRQDTATWTPDCQQAFTQWLHADPAHQAAYDRIAASWALCDALPRPVLRPAEGAPRATPPEHAAVAEALAAPLAEPLIIRPGARRPARRKQRDGWQGWGLALAASLVMLAGIWQWQSSPAPTFTQVASAQQQAELLQLPDGSRVQLNRDSAVQVAFYPDRRDVVLAQGEAFFEVAAQAGVPFVVQTGDTRIQVVGTAFNVRATPVAVYVAVQQGTVEVLAGPPAQRQRALLTAGQAVVAQQASGQMTPMTRSAAQIGSWRQGQLAFRDATLAEVVEELARYVPAGIELASPAVARLRLSGFASTSQPEAFLDTLPQLLPVTVRRLEDGRYWIGV